MCMKQDVAESFEIHVVGWVNSKFQRLIVGGYHIYEKLGTKNNHFFWFRGINLSKKNVYEFVQLSSTPEKGKF